MTNNIDEQIASTMKGLFRTLLRDIQTGDHIPDLGLMDFPQKPQLVKGLGHGPRTGKQYERTTVALDKILADLVHQEALGKHESIGRIIESALWIRYGRPVLSYQKDRGPD
jgi:hypothetical protein